MNAYTEIRELREKLNFSQREIASLLGYSHRTIVRWESGKSKPRNATFEYLRELVSKKEPTAQEGKPLFRFIDLFAGIGGMRLGFEGAGGKCVFTCEWNPEAQKTYEANFPGDHPFAGDIREVHPEDVPPHDPTANLIRRRMFDTAPPDELQGKYLINGWIKLLGDERPVWMDDSQSHIAFLDKSREGKIRAYVRIFNIFEGSIIVSHEADRYSDFQARFLCINPETGKCLLSSLSEAISRLGKR